MQDEDLAIKIRDVRVTFGSTKALDGVDLSVRRGESHALLGRNGAGKSTLISVLTGLTEPTSGLVEIAGADEEPYPSGSPAGLACVYQKSTLIDGLTAAENISLAAYPLRRGMVDWPQMKARGRDLLGDWGFARLIDREVGELAPLERKVVEVCRAMSQGPRILLLDEPTAGLDDGACQELFAQIDQARQRGVTIVYVSHHLDEVFRVCDAVTILRDGRTVKQCSTAEINTGQIVDVLSGGTGEHTAARRSHTTTHTTLPADAPVVLQADSVQLTDRSAPITLSMRRGEAVGLTGLDGAGHVQLAQALAGQLPFAGGEVRVDGRRLRPGNIGNAIDAGVGFVPEDRHVNGFAPELSVEENATLSVLNRLRGKMGLLDRRARRQRYLELSQTWAIKAASADQAVQELSGGNQQKVVLARALAADPHLLVLIHPSAGVDVTAKDSIYASIRQQQDEGCAVLVVSSDDDDLEVCDRVLVMYKGALHAELARGWQERDLVAAVQGSDTPAVPSDSPSRAAAGSPHGSPTC